MPSPSPTAPTLAHASRYCSARAVALAHGTDSDSRGSRTFYHWGEWPGGDRVTVDHSKVTSAEVLWSVRWD